jgi:hypothetical protein
MKKIGNTSFNEESIKKMTLKDFKETYKDIIKGQDLGKIYKEVTGSKGEPERHGNNVG